MSLICTITTIQPPTPCVESLVERLEELGGSLIVAGDRKGPHGYGFDQAHVRFLSIDDQLNGPFALARALPTGHYCRKNVAYLQAIANGATCIYETDDDNAPRDNWSARTESVALANVVASPSDSSLESNRWVNVYQYFSDELIWPRGLPLDRIHARIPGDDVAATQNVTAPIQQGLVNGSPDVDAIWRLVADRPFAFDDSPSVYLAPGNWCPFNTQSTWWWPTAYALLYVPSFCSFRMCDIWKSFIAQRCLWAMDMGIVFHAPEVDQDRNEHDLMHDFRDEIPGYDRNAELVDILASVPLEAGATAVAPNLRRCYAALVEAEFFPTDELRLVDAWLSDISDIG